MRFSRCILSCAALLILPPLAARAQDKPASEQSSAVVTPLKLQVLLTEYEGTKKISSLPYTLSLAAIAEPRPTRNYTQLRDGIRVPVVTASKAGENGIQYIDVGTNIDARAARTDGDTYSVELTIDRSSLVERTANNQAKEWAPGDPSPSTQPLIRDFKNNITTLLHDGRAAEATVAVDPISGHILKVEVTLTAIK